MNAIWTFLGYALFLAAVVPVFVVVMWLSTKVSYRFSRFGPWAELGVHFLSWIFVAALLLTALHYTEPYWGWMP